MKPTFQPSPLNGQEWDPAEVDRAGGFKNYLIELSAKYGGAWTTFNTFGWGILHQYRNRSSVPAADVKADFIHTDGLAVNGKWVPWTDAQIIRDQQIGGLQ